MKKKAEEIIVEFFNDRFSRSIADQLLKQKMRKFGIKGFSSLTFKQKISFGQKIVESVFKKFYSKQKIENIKILLLLRFSLNEAIEKVEKMIHKKSEVKLEPLVNVDIEYADSLLQEIDSNDTIKFGFESSNLLEGLLMFSMDKKEVIDFANIMMQAMTGSASSGQEIDDMKISAVNEFFNILLPAFVSCIGDAFGEEVYFTPISYESFKEKYFFQGEFIKPEKIYTSSTTINLGKKDYTGKIYFFIKQSMESFESLVDQASQKKDPLEQSPPKVMVQLTGDVRQDVESFFKLLHLSYTEIDNILNDMNNQTINGFKYKDYESFTQKLIAGHFRKASDAKKDNIKYNLAKIFGF
ncbi:MAG: hypothetical protein ACQEP1_02355 [Nanobdellota archaeon]